VASLGIWECGAIALARVVQVTADLRVFIIPAQFDDLRLNGKRGLEKNAES
jgi:hypothetical protein